MSSIDSIVNDVKRQEATAEAVMLELKSEPKSAERTVIASDILRVYCHRCDREEMIETTDEDGIKLDCCGWTDFTLDRRIRPDHATGVDGEVIVSDKFDEEEATERFTCPGCGSGQEEGSFSLRCWEYGARHAVYEIDSFDGPEAAYACTGSLDDIFEECWDDRDGFKFICDHCGEVFYEFDDNEA